VNETQKHSRIALTVSSRPDSSAAQLPTYRGAMIAIEDLARRDSEFTFHLDVFDDHGDTAVTQRFAEAIVADPSYVAAVGPMGSSEALVNARVFDEAGMLHVSPCASHPELCRIGLRTFFRLVANEEAQGGELAKIARQYLGAARVSVVSDSDAFGRSVTGNFRTAYEALGGEIAGVAEFERGSSEFSTLVDDVAVGAPDLVFFAVHGMEGKAISTALRERGLTMPFLGTDAMKTSFFLGGGDGNGDAFHTHSGADFRRLPSAAEFRTSYEAQHKSDSTYSTEAYDSVMLIAEAVGRAKSTNRGAVLAEFRKMATSGYEGATGLVRFADNGEPAAPSISLYRVGRDADGRVMEYLGTTQSLLSNHPA
jgi:branched-chain amino acid transport system substrate-binding protein